MTHSPPTILIADDEDIVRALVARALREAGYRVMQVQHGAAAIALWSLYPEAPFVAVSQSQANLMAPLNVVGTVHHGLPLDAMALNDRPRGDYLAFIGRISAEKRPDRAIAIARRAGMRLRIAAKVDAVDRDYFRRSIEPLLADPHVDFIGEIGEERKAEFLGNARALLFPVDWPEPFGLVMIEAMACGTPVIAWRCGAVPEVVEHGVTGYVVESELEAARAVARIEEIDRRRVRRRFEERFSAERMTRDYVNIYSSLPERANPWARAA